MNILILDNGSIHIDEIVKTYEGHHVKIKRYGEHSRVDQDKLHLIVLSGGSTHNAVELGKNYHLWFQNELDLIIHAKIPILGICMGFELICLAFGARVGKLRRVVRGERKIHIAENGKALFGCQELSAYEAHAWAIQEVDPVKLSVLARSETGIEAIRHKTKRILGVQFHPEVETGTVPVLRNMAEKLTAEYF